MNNRQVFLTVLISMLVISFQLMSCKSKEEKAEETLDDFMEAVEEKDFEEAKELSTPETEEVLDVVEEEIETYEDENEEEPEIEYEIIEKTYAEDKAKFKVKIIVGEKERVEVINLVIVEDDWLVVMPARQLTFIRFIVFRNRYHLIIKQHKIKYKKKHSKKSKSRKKSSSKRKRSKSKIKIKIDM